MLCGSCVSMWCVSVWVNVRSSWNVRREIEITFQKHRLMICYTFEHIWAHFVHIYTQKITLKLSIFSALFRCISAIVSVCVTLILRLGAEHPIFLSFVIVTFYLWALSSNATNVARRATSGRSKKMINQCYSYHQRANKRLFDKWKIPFKWTETEERK